MIEDSFKDLTSYENVKLIISENPLCQVMKGTLKYKGVKALFISSSNACINGLTHEEQKTRTGICQKCSSTTPNDGFIRYAKELEDKHNPPIQDGPQVSK